MAHHLRRRPGGRSTSALPCDRPIQTRLWRRRSGRGTPYAIRSAYSRARADFPDRLFAALARRAVRTSTAVTMAARSSTRSDGRRVMVSPLDSAATYRRTSKRVDVEALKVNHPIQDVVARYGIELRRQGRAAIGRCPFHPDHGRPNLHVWGDTRSWWCFRCNVGGDVIRFVELAEGVTFREAVDRLSAGGSVGLLIARPASSGRVPPAAQTAPSCD